MSSKDNVCLGYDFKTYSVRVMCNNCNYGITFIKIPKGQLANYYLKDIECINCGCKSLLKC